MSQSGGEKYFQMRSAARIVLAHVGTDMPVAAG